MHLEKGGNMKIRYILLFVMLSSVLSHAQKELAMFIDKAGKIVVIPKLTHYDLNIPEFSYNTYLTTSDSKRELEKRLNEFVPTSTFSSLTERPMDMQVLSGAYRPFFNIYAPMLRRVSPMAFDFQETTFSPLNENFGVMITGTQYTWPGAGGLTTISPRLVWQNGPLSIAGGGFAGRYYTPFNPSPELMLGVDTHIRYDINDRFAVRAWGQYVHYQDDEKNNPHMLMNPFYNHTGVGGAFEVKFNDNFGIGVGVNYEYNHLQRRMQPEYLIYPVFKTKGGTQFRIF